MRQTVKTENVVESLLFPRLRGLSKASLEEMKILADAVPYFFQGIVEQQKQKFGGLTYFNTIEEVVEETKSRFGVDKVNIAGHSMGGLKIIDYLLDHSHNIDTCVTVATPFEGTPLALLNPIAYLFGVSPVTAQQMLGIGYLEELKKYFRDHYPLDVKFKNVIGNLDEIVFPWNTSLVDFAGNDYDNIDEYVLEYTMHANAFDCSFTYGLLKDLLETSDKPLVVTHGYTMNGNYFNRFFKYLEVMNPELLTRVCPVSYDYDEKM
ncbi:MAG: alpha/beta fold hydrolase [Nanoarchaeota archaeon]